jgi:Rps23 Pro-64 3,4-dihydroxylase Tpa1-like proline 4-hydroxylase
MSATPAAHPLHSRKQVRKLTAILYANPGWSAEAGGELRLHLRRPDGHSFTKDVAPLDNRSALFCLHTRMRTHMHTHVHTMHRYTYSQVGRLLV